MPARGSNSTARPCAIGSARRPGCSIRSWRRSASTSSPPRRSTATTRLSRCWRQGLVGPRPVGCGSMCATIGRSAVRHRQLPPTSTARPWRRASGRSHGRVHRLSPGRWLCRVRGAVRYRPHQSRRPNASITEVACWAHCRRKFFDVWEATKSPVAKEALDRIAAIYVIEAKAAFAPAAERVEHRAETAPLLDAFFAWAEATVVKLSAKSALAEAFRYTIKRREALSRFVTDGRLEVDNNIAENAMRGIALGRKNYLFCRLRYRRRPRRIHLHHRADGKAQRRKPGGLSQGYADQDRRRASHQSDRRADAVADELAEPPRSLR